MKTIPSLNVTQILQTGNTGDDIAMNPVIVGPHYFVRSLDSLSERDAAFIGGNDLVMAWPDLPSAAEVDLDSVIVTLKNARVMLGTASASGMSSTLTFTSQLVDMSDNGGAARAADLSRDVRVGDIVAGAGWSAQVIAIIEEHVPLDTPATVVSAFAGGSPAGNNGVASITEILNDSGLVLSTPVGNLVPLNTTSVLLDLVCATLGVCNAQGEWITAPTFTVASCSISGVTPVISAVADESGDDTLLVSIVLGTQTISFIITGEANGGIAAGDNLNILFTQAYSPVLPSVEEDTVADFLYNSNVDKTLYVDIVAATDDPDDPVVKVTDVNGVSYATEFVPGEGSDSDEGKVRVVSSSTALSDFMLNLSGLVAGTRIVLTFPGQDNTLAKKLLINRVPGLAQATTLTIYGYIAQTDLSLYSAYPVPNYTVDAEDGVTLASGAAIDVSGTLTALASADVYISYRALKKTYCSAVTKLNTAAEVIAALGDISSLNPLGAAAYYAASNSGGVPVYIVATEGETASDFVAATALIKYLRAAYTVTPASQLKSVLDAVAAFVDGQAAVAGGAYRKICFVSPTMSPVFQVYPAPEAVTPVTATITAYNSETTQFRLVTFTDGGLDALALRAGDQLRLGYGTGNDGKDTYDTFVISEVLNDDQLILVTGPSAAYAVATRVEIWRTATGSDYASQFVAFATSFKNRVTRSTFPPELPNSDGVTMPGYCAAAASAGYKSSLPAHQPMYGGVLVGFSGARTSAMPVISEENYQTMADGGVFILASDASGNCSVKAAVTTDVSDVQRAQEQITSNFDYLTFGFSDVIAAYIGKCNMTTSVFSAMAAGLESRAMKFISEGASNTLIGAPLISFKITDGPRVDAVLQDRFVIVMDLGMPAAGNDGQITLYGNLAV